MPESTRRQIGKYVIEAELGRGGFGVVYQAYDPTVVRRVAVKVLTALGDHQLLTRFKNEAAATGNLRHKNIVTIYDYGDDDGVPYIVMELLEGEDLNQVIASGRPMALSQKVSVMIQVADGLHSAHRAGVVHRDVKPGNIRLLPDGTVKLMDFGIARLVAGSAGTRLTRQGHVVGTLYYMSPEQVMGEEVDALSDIFAYGSTYYELLTGKHPFRGADPRSVFHKITAEDPEPIRNLVPDCPEALEKIVGRTLQKDRDLRYQSLRDVQLDTEPILIELRQERAESLVGEAKRLYDAGDVEKAQTVLGEVFDLDPANRYARRLRETIQTQLLSRLIRPKVEALVKKAEDASSSRRYEDAIESFEAACRLDRSNQELSGRLQQARRLLSLSREMQGLIADARRNFSKQNLERAVELLLQVLDQDAANPDAQRLLHEVRTAITSRERERAYQEKLQHAKELLRADGFDESGRLLADLDPEFRNREEVRTLAAQIRSSKEAFERQQQLNRELGAVRELLADAQFEAAINRVELLMRSFPEEVEPTRLFMRAHREFAAYSKRQALDKLDEEITSQIEGGDFERALDLVNQSLKTYTSEPRLLETQRRIEAEWARHKRESAIARLLEDAERYSAQNELEKASEVLEGATQQYPDEPRLWQLLASTRDALAAKLREESIVSLLNQARGHFQESEYQPALDAIERGFAEYGNDPRLAKLREQVALAKEAREHAEAVRQALEDAQTSVARQDFSRAITLLESAADRFPEEDQLRDALRSARRELAAKRRDEAIEALCVKALAQTARRDFTSALKTVDQGLEHYGGDERLAALRGKVLSAQADWMRAEAIDQAIAEAQRHLAQGEPEQALKSLDPVLAQYTDDPKLLEARNVAEEGLVAKRREEAIEAIGKQARAHLEAGAYQAALDLLDGSLAEYDGERRLADLRGVVESAKAKWERALAINGMLEASRKLLGQSEFEQAIVLLQSGLNEYPGDPQLALEIDLVRAELASKQRDDAIQVTSAQAQAQLDRGEHQNALDLVGHAIDQYGSDPRLTASRDRIVSAKAEWERSEAVRQALDNAQISIAQQDFDRAIGLLESAAKRYPGEPKLREGLMAAQAARAAKRRDEAIESICKQAYAETDKRDFARALKTVDRGETEFGQDPRLVSAREKILAMQAEWERVRSVRLVIADSQKRLAQGKPEKAVESLGAALMRYPGDAQLTEALKVARTALESTRREEAIESLLRQVERSLQSQKFGSAIDALDSGVTEYGPDRRFSDLRGKALSLKADWERAEALRQLVSEARNRIAGGEAENAFELLESARSRFTGESQFESTFSAAREAIATKRKEQAIETACESAQGLIEQREYDRVVEIIEEASKVLGKDPRLAGVRDKAAAARAEWERSQAIRQVLEDSRKLTSEDDLKAALELLNRALAKYPGVQELMQALAETRQALQSAQKETAIVAVIKETRRFLESQDFPTALAMVQRGLKTYGPQERLAELRDVVLAGQAGWQRKEFLERIYSEANRQLDRGKFEAALQEVERGLKESPNDGRLLELREAILGKAEAQRVSGEIKSAIERAEGLRERGQHDEALTLLERTLNGHPSNPELVAAIVATIEDVGAAGPIAIENICRDARAYVLAGKFELAFQSMGKALRLQKEARQTKTQELAQKTRTEAATAAGTGSALHREAGSVASVKEETGDHLLLDGIRDSTGEIPITSAPLGSPALIRRSGISDDEFVQPLTARGRGPAKRWLLGLAVLLIAVLAVVIRIALTPKLPVLTIRNLTAGATILVNHQKCSAPTCEFRLKPGQYRVQVSADGYREKTETATLNEGRAHSSMSIVLEPLSPTARITANFAEGDVVLDNQRAGRMQGGQFVFEQLPPGRHDLQISSKEGKASVSFDADYAKLPSFTNVSQQNTQLIALGSFGNRAALICSNCSGAVSIDDREVGELKNRTITIDNVAPGTHRVKVGDQSLVFTASGAPEINLGLNSSGNFGALLIDASDENATVFIDGNKYPRQTSRGQLLIPTEAKQHTIRVAKDGYRAEPREIRVQLARGEQFVARFKLIPEPARLLVSGQLAGTAVRIDGSPAGTVGPNGAFSTQVPPGDHQIEFRKDGFTPVQIHRSFEAGGRVALSSSDATLVAKAGPAPPPEPSPKPDPNLAEKTEWERIAGAQSVTQLEDFINKYPAGIHHEEAQARLKELQRQQGAAAREQAWAAIDKNSKASLQEFLSKYGEGTHSQDARTMIAGIDKQEADEFANAQRAKEQSTRQAADRQSILNTLSEFEAAYNRKDLAALQGLWGGMPKNIIDSYRNQFRDARTLTFELKPAAPTGISGDTATLICTRTLKFTAKNGEHPPETNERVRVTLSRSGTQWVIRTITPF